MMFSRMHVCVCAFLCEDVSRAFRIKNQRVDALSIRYRFRRPRTFLFMHHPNFFIFICAFSRLNLLLFTS